MQKYYERYWRRKPAELEDFTYKWSSLISLIPRKSKLTILDYGCGKGKILSLISKMNPSAVLYGADISEEAIRVAGKTVPKAKILVIDDEQHVSLPAHSCDFIVSLDVIEHVYDTERMFEEFNRLLTKDGTLLLSTPYHGLIKNLIIALIGFETVFTPTTAHIRFYTRNTLTSIVKRFGFEPKIFGRYGRFYPVNNGMFLLAKKVNTI